jgi:hypothetical protein
LQIGARIATGRQEGMIGRACVCRASLAALDVYCRMHVLQDRDSGGGAWECAESLQIGVERGRESALWAIRS